MDVRLHVDPHRLLSETPWGRQIYRAQLDAQNAAKKGVPLSVAAARASVPQAFPSIPCHFATNRRHETVSGSKRSSAGAAEDGWVVPAVQQSQALPPSYAPRVFRRIDVSSTMLNDDEDFTIDVRSNRNQNHWFEIRLRICILTWCCQVLSQHMIVSEKTAFIHFPFSNWSPSLFFMVRLYEMQPKEILLLLHKDPSHQYILKGEFKRVLSRYSGDVLTGMNRTAHVLAQICWWHKHKKATPMRCCSSARNEGATQWEVRSTTRDGADDRCSRRRGGLFPQKRCSPEHTFTVSTRFVHVFSRVPLSFTRVRTLKKVKVSQDIYFGHVFPTADVGV